MRYSQMLSFAALSLLSRPASAADAVPARYNIHFQSTVIDQGHARLRSPYVGPNSFRAAPESAATVTATLFLGLRLRPGTEFYVDPELTGGRGMSSTLGMAGFPNGEAFRVGDPQPTILASRLFIKQLIDLGGEEESVEDAQNQLFGRQTARRLTVVAGKFGLADYFDKNAYADDPRSQFMNWAVMNSAAFDYAADIRGYTWGLMGEYHDAAWAVRGAFTGMPKQANTNDMDRRIGRAHGINAEFERSLRLGGHKGTARLMVYLNEANMGSYGQTLNDASFNMDITRNRAYGRSKFGLTSSDDLEVAANLGAFTRLSWNDGRNESFVYTEVDASQVLGVSWKPAVLGRPNDACGAVLALNELSNPHRRYLSAGGSGFLLGDGKMHYGPEFITEVYYRLQAAPHLAFSPDAQLIANPGYNRDRGPAPVWGVRVHAEF